MNWTKLDCIQEFKRIVESYPDKSITRDFFRKVSELSETTYQRFFGTFSEFKTQAGYDLHSHQDKILSDISRHSSNDKLREMNVEKQQYEDKYLRPCSKRFQTIMICSDTHDIYCDPFYLSTFIDTLYRVQPETVILGGDIVDNVEFSKHWNDPRDYKLVERIQWLHKFLESIRNILPNAEIDYICGNHEAFMLKHLCFSSPQMMTLLYDIHGHTISSLLGLDKYQVNFITRNDLSVFTDAEFKKEIKKNYVIKHNCLQVDHYPIKSPIMPTVWGHHHKHLVQSHSNPIYGTFETHQLGTGHIRNASFCDASKWNQGWLISHVDIQKQKVQFEYINTTYDFCMIGGKFYKRTEDQLIKE